MYTKQTAWRHLQQKDRDRMEALLDRGMKQCEIAKILKVDPGTISREKKKQRQDGRYDADTAEQKAANARRRSKRKGMKVEDDAKLRAYVIRNLEVKRSPDEISGRMWRDGEPFFASKNAIYTWIYSAYGQQYSRYLCTKRWHRRKQKRKLAREMIPNRKSIAMRPRGAANKTRYGHYEADTAVAPRRAANTEALALAAEMRTKLLLGTKIPSLSPKEMAKAMRSFRREADMKSVTLDNGIENKNHEGWGVSSYFADPHAPWQKPLIENSIGLLRRWRFPKGTDWGKVSEEALQEAITFLNNKYRKSLGYESALEVARAHGIIKTNKNTLVG